MAELASLLESIGSETREGAVDLVLIVTPTGLYEWAGDELSAAEAVALMRAAARRAALDAHVRMCKVCGCTDHSACSPPCTWVARDLCSSHERGRR